MFLLIFITVPQAEDVDLNAHLHGNWTLANAKSRLHQYCQQNRIPADFKYSPGGPDHNRWSMVAKDGGYSFERNCVLCRWESETLK